MSQAVEECGITERRFLINEIWGERYVRDKEVPDNLKCTGNNCTISVAVKNNKLNTELKQ